MTPGQVIPRSLVPFTFSILALYALIVFLSLLALRLLNLWQGIRAQDQTGESSGTS